MKSSVWNHFPCAKSRKGYQNIKLEENRSMDDQSHKYFCWFVRERSVQAFEGCPWGEQGSIFRAEVAKKPRAEYLVVRNTIYFTILKLNSSQFLLSYQKSVYPTRRYIFSRVLQIAQTYCIENQGTKILNYKIMSWKMWATVFDQGNNFPFREVSKTLTTSDPNMEFRKQPRKRKHRDLYN